MKFGNSPSDTVNIQFLAVALRLAWIPIPTPP
jgi:hypothetical protein